ncbi:hypothetical protein ACIBQ1_38495 [Nonomuraea sp. NPDC050153]|uniref:hypothetical protein n=1 Tax=Nonomuraea sp. NPDC050153 TaxID=3364359 RepID=UPI0037BD7C28
MPSRLIAMVVLVAGCAAGVLAGAWLTDAIRAYEATHRQVIAEVVEEKAIVAQVTWKDAAGMRQTGQVRMPLDRVGGVQARIWLDPRGRPVSRPFGPVEVAFGVLVAGTAAGGAVWLMLWQARSVAHWWTARRAVRHFDGQWRDYAHKG